MWDSSGFWRARRHCVAIVDVVSRYWIDYLLTPEFTSTQVQVSKTDNNFAVSIGHEIRDNNLPQVITDYIHVWKPSDFPGGVIDYPHIEKELLRLIVAFRISTMVFDQYNSIGTIQRLNASKGAEAPWEVEGSGGFGRGVVHPVPEVDFGIVAQPS